MGLDMYFEGTFSTRAFTERSLDKTEVALDPSFESTLESIGFENAPMEFTNWNYYSVNIPIAIGEKLIVSTTGLLKTCRVGTITVIVIMLVMNR